MNTLCYVGIPQKWESPKGVMMRTALHNGYRTVKSMCAALEVPCHGDALDLLTEQSSLIRKLAMAAPEIEQALLHNTYTVKNVGTVLWIIDDIVLYRPQFAQHFIYCPKCLRTEIITVFQDIKGVLACPIHQSRLVTQCPACHLREHWTTAGLLFCKCGFDRRNTKCQNGKLYEVDRLETFGPNTYITRLSRIADLAQICDDIWQSRKPSNEKTASRLTDAVQEHASNMISTQLAKFPGFTRAMHLSPWTSSHPLLATLADHMIDEKCSINAICPSGQCCAEVELTLDQITSSIGGKKIWSKHKKFVSDNFEVSLLSPQPSFYYSQTPICKLLHDRAVNLEREKTDTEKNLCNVEEAAELLNCSSTTARQLEKSGYLQRDHQSNKSRKNKPLIIQKTSITNFNRTYFLVGSISQSLKTKPFQLVRQLNLLGIASEHDNPGTYFYKKYKIIDIWERLKEALENPSALHPIVLPPTQDIHNMLIMTSVNTATPETINPSTFLNDELLQENNTNYYTTNQAAELLNISGRLLWHRFILTGLITPEIFDDMSHYSRANIQTMNTHLKHHASIDQATKILECTYKKGYSLIKSFKLQPSCALIYSNGAIQLLYSPNDIYDLKNYLHT